MTEEDAVAEMADDTHIAVIGMSCRFPGADDVDGFWRNLAGGVESLDRLSREELLAAGEPASVIDDPRYVPVHGKLRSAADLDAGLFGYSPHDAALIDPQQRVFLECSWEALENAGHDPRTYPHSIGVYAGCPLSTYTFLLYLDQGRGSEAQRYQFAISTGLDHVSTRTSYKLGLTGPSVTVLATCATSLVAIHQACQALLGGECDMALAGGASVRVPPRGYLYAEGTVASPDGHVRAFDADAGGTVGGDGVGVVVLKRLADAIADGDRVRAVVRGSAVNNLGSDRVGYTAPGVTGQAQVISRAQLLADVAPETISYVEAHGTGTLMGDPIEVAALIRAFRARTDKVGYCALGSVKTNIGHTDSAAGVASFIKTVLALEHGALPPSLHFQRPNPEIPFETSPFFVNTELREWKSNGSPRRAGVSSFGIGGTNAHVILEEAPAPRPTEPDLPAQLVVLSARTPTALVAATSRLAEHLAAHPDVPIADLAFSLQTGRQAMSDRRFVVCTDTADLIAVLDDTLTRSAKAHELGRMVHARQRARDRDTVFAFPGGATDAGVVRALYRSVPDFRALVDECCLLLAAELGSDPREWLTAAVGTPPAELAEPLLFVVEYALARQLVAWGITPVAAVGHGVGELVAACVAGVFDLPDALTLVARRAGFVARTPDRASLVVLLPEEELRAMLPDGIAVTAVDGSARCVVSGPQDAVRLLADELTRLDVDHEQARGQAPNSAALEPILDEYAEQVRQARPRPPTMPYLSGVTGTWVTAEQATDPLHWRRQLRDPIRFADCLSVLLEEADRVLVEVGPGAGLTGLARAHPAAGLGSKAVPVGAPRQQGDDDLHAMLTGIGNLWALGVTVDWPALHAPHRRQRIPLPGYPFERQRYLLDPAELLRGVQHPAPADPAGGTPASSGSGETDLYQQVHAIFADVLGIEQVPAEDDFFELGGDSLSATLLTSRVRDDLGIDVPLENIFDYSTLATFVPSLAVVTGPNGAP